MDYNKLAQVKVADSALDPAMEGKKKKIQDAIERRRAARERAREAINRTQKYGEFKVTDGFKSLKNKIKDELLETETTEDAVTACLNALEGQPVEQVLAATVEVLAEAIDVLQGEESLEE